MKFPEAALQQHIAVLGKTGSGKTYAAKGIVERLLDQRRQVCTLDPTGAWWGLRLDADGKGKGYDVILLGGAHADIPLAERSGAAVARLVTEQHASVVIDTSGLTVGEYTRWFIDFAGTLYTTIRDPLHLVIDEAHYFMPQGKSPDVDAGRMLHAGNRLMSGGRSKGIRGLLITQRPAKLHKDSLTCADTLIAMRVIAPQDRQAIKDWIDGAGDPIKGKGVLDSLASLKRGEGWVWYPEGEYLERTSFPKIATYDSSATPKHGAKAGPEPSAINLAEVNAAMAEAVKEAEANDPRLLRQKIAELSHKLAGKAPTEKLIEKIVEMPVLKDGQLDRTEKAAARMEQYGQKFLAEAAELRRLIAPASAPRITPRVVRSPIPIKRALVPHSAPSGEAASLASAQRKLLGALAFLEQVGIAIPDKTQVSLFAGLSPTAGHTLNMYGGLRSTGLIEYPDSGHVRLTDAGRALADPGRVPQTAEEMQQMLLGKIATAQRKILTVLLDAYPEPVDKREAAENAGLSPDAGHTLNMYGGLRSMGLIDYPSPGKVVALPVLFLQ